MPIISLNDAGLRTLPVPATGQTEFWDASFKAGPFACRVSQGGSKTFLVRYKNRRIVIGHYPTISLSEARTEAKRLLAEFTLGRVRPQSITYPQAVALFLEEKQKNRRKGTTDSYKGLLNSTGLVGQLSEITHEEVRRRLSKFKTHGAYNHHLVALTVFFNWCMKRRYIEHNPTLGLSKHATSPRSRILTDEELKAVWTAAEQCGQFGVIVKLLITTGQRKGEIAALQTSWIQNDTITLPKETTKNGRQHAFPFGLLIKELLSNHHGNQSPLLFPARLSGFSRPFSGWSKSKKTLDKLANIAPYTLHDLRRTYRSNLARLGIAPHIAERLVNHISAQSQMERVYNRHAYLEEMREAVQVYDSWLTSLCGR